jgi:SAM-dependent methyltransferase
MKPKTHSGSDEVYLVEWRGHQRHYYDIEDVRHDYLYDDVLAASEVGPSSRALDFGCGSGDFLARWLAPRVAFACGYDIDAEGVELARQQCSSLGNAQLHDDLASVGDNFDIVFLNAVWMTLPDESSCIELLTEVRRHVRVGGRFVAAVTHPCFRDVETPSRKTTLRHSDYLTSPKPFRVTLRGSKNGKMVSFIDYHWTLTDFSRQLSASGWSDCRLIEVPHRDRGAPPRSGSLPIWLLILAENS